VVAGAFHGIFRRDPAGVWQPMTLPSTIYAPHVWGTSDSSVFAVGDGKIFRFDGLTWTDQSPLYAGTLPWLVGVWGTAPDNVYAISTSSMLHFDGSAWRDVPGISATSMIDIAGSGPDDIFVLLGDSSFLHWDGARWAPADSGIAVGATIPSAVLVHANQWVVSGSAYVFGGPRGLMHHSVRTGPGGNGK
jgi:hypothetical protein